jgi:hypothetical protein
MLDGIPELLMLHGCCMYAAWKHLCTHLNAAVVDSGICFWDVQRPLWMLSLSFKILSKLQENTVYDFHPRWR